MTRRLAGAAAALIAAVAAVLPIRAETPESSSKWKLTPFTYCRYDVDVRGLRDPYVQLGRVPAPYQFTCPFLPGQESPVEVHTQRSGSLACLKSDLQGIPVRAVSQLSQHESRLARECTPTMRPATPSANKAAGDVYLIASPMEFAGHRASSGSDVEEKVRMLIEKDGLPVSYFGMGFDSKDHVVLNRYICLEMLKGANFDPYPLFGSANILFLPGTHEVKGGRNCSTAVKQEPSYFGPSFVNMSGELRPNTYFELQLARSTASPIGDDFYRALSESFSGRGIADEPIPRVLQGPTPSWPAHTRQMQVQDGFDHAVYVKFKT